MRLLITCEFDDGTQTLIKNPGTEADLRVLEEARHGDPELILLVDCQVTSDGPVRERMIRAGCITGLELAR